MDQQAKQPPPSRLFLPSPIETRDDLEEKFERSYQFVQSITAGLNEKNIHNVLNNAVMKEKGYDEVSLGLLVTILSEPQNAVRCYRDLTLITRDGFGLVLTHLSQLVLDRYFRLNDIAKSQILWLAREMIRNAVSGVDNLCMCLMRHAAGGDVSARNITLVESLLDIFIENRVWLEKLQVLLPLVVYTYLRLIEDHNAPFLQNLRAKEVGFVVSLLREKFQECVVIGRDLARLLQNIARIPEIELLWQDMLNNPKALSPGFTGILQLLQTRTSRRYLQSRLTPEMERKLVFLTSQVRFGNHKRYQDWFQRQYLATLESQSLRCDMIRFIVGVIHPTNELLCSEIIPRWAVIGWLLTTCTSPVAVSNAKLALFYDWLFFDPERDNIMNIEPAILVMHHSMRSHPAVSATLLDFLCRIIANFYPPLTEKVRAGIFNSLRQILDKRVLPSLLPLFDNSKLDRELRNMIRVTFKEFCVPQESSSKEENCNNHVMTDEPVFSDDDEQPAHEEDTDDDDIPLAKVRLKEKVDRVEDGPLNNALLKLQAELLREKQRPLMEELVKLIVELEEDSDIIPLIARSLVPVIFQDNGFRLHFQPPDITDEGESLHVQNPIFVIFKNLYESYQNDDQQKHPLLKLLMEIQLTNNIGHLLLFYLKTRTKISAIKITIYKEFCQCVEKKLDTCLFDDLNACHITDNNLMMYILPDLFKDFKQQTINNPQIIKIILSTIDPIQLSDLISKIMQGNLTMFKVDNLQNLLKSSLSWESIEQIFLWQLIQAHDIPLEIIIPLISHLDYKNHAEASTAVTLMLKQEKPTSDYLKYLFSRDNKNSCDPLIFTMIKHWCDVNLEKIGELVANLLSTRYPATSPNKRKRLSNKSLSATVPSADQVLGHLDQLRVNDALGLYSLEVVQRALQLAQSNSSDGQRKQFGELFALVEEEEVEVKGKTTGRGRKPAAKQVNKRNAKEVSESSEDTSEEEEIVKPKQAKKRKKVMSDSD